ncbi:MAG: family 1 glycosylhydrolase [Acidimicrobiales bacterium]
MSTRPRLLVTIEGYAVEGGLDQPGAPATCYLPTIALGRHAGPGDADQLWRDYEEVLNLVPELGVDGVRLSVEWARVEPRCGFVDDVALSRYQAVVRHARALGLDVTVVLIDAAWPSWLGLEAWLLPWTVPHVIEHARRVVGRLGSDLTGVVAFASPQELVSAGFVRASAPPWRRRARKDADFATRQIDAVLATLRNDDVVGPRLVASSATLTLNAHREEFTRSLRAHLVDEIYVRSLLAGHGPTSVARGLVARRGNSWRVSASDSVLAALREFSSR